MVDGAKKKYRMMIAFLILLSAALVGTYWLSTGKKEEKTERVTFFNMPLPGTGSDALNAGFTDCQPNTARDAMECNLARGLAGDRLMMGAPIAGVRVSLRLPDGSGKSDIATVPVDGLEYHSLSFDLANRVCTDGYHASEIHEKLRQAQSPSCWHGQRDLDYVRLQLAAGGWIATNTSYAVDDIMFQSWSNPKNPLAIATFPSGPGSSPDSVMVMFSSTEIARASIQSAAKNNKL